MTHNLNLYKNDKVEDCFNAFLLQDAKFTSNEEYPILTKDMVSEDIPIKIMPFNKAINSKEDLSDTYICFYAPDSSFERVARNPEKYLDFFARTAGIIGFDFSIYSDMPVVKQKAQMFDNLSLTYYYGNKGIPIIPNIRAGNDDLIPEFLESIPKNKSISIGTHGCMKTIHEKCEWFCFLEKILPILKPKNIIVYGTISSNIFDQFKKDYNFFVYEPWIESDLKRRKHYASN